MIIQTVYVLLNTVILSSAEFLSAVRKDSHILFSPCLVVTLSYNGVMNCHKTKYSALVIPSVAYTLFHKSDI